MAIVDAVLMCHAPIVIPAVGGPRASECEQTTTAMVRMAEELVTRQPDVLVCLSPHTPRLRRQFGIYGGGPRGDFARFGAPQAVVSLPPADRAAGLLLAAAGELAAPIDVPELDHGAAVPLWFIEKAGFTGPTVVVALPWDCTHDVCRGLGQALRAAADEDGRRWAILASGDMSHCLKPGAPSGFDPAGQRFDDAFVNLLTDGPLDSGLRGLDALREEACEDVVDTVEVAATATGFVEVRDVVSYEGPFGVGYCIARLMA